MMDIMKNKGFRFCLHRIMKRGDYLGVWLTKRIFSQKGHTFGVPFIKRIAYDNKICCTKYWNSEGKKLSTSEVTSCAFGLQFFKRNYGHALTILKQF